MYSGCDTVFTYITSLYVALVAGCLFVEDCQRYCFSAKTLDCSHQHSGGHTQLAFLLRVKVFLGRSVDDICVVDNG